MLVGTGLGFLLIAGILGVALRSVRSGASHLVAADLMGHDTHGLQLCGPYIGALESGSMAGSG